MVKAVFDEAASPMPRNPFTVGIHDDASHTSLPWDPASDPQVYERANYYQVLHSWRPEARR